jgi:hypothetical protein
MKGILSRKSGESSPMHLLLNLCAPLQPRIRAACPHLNLSASGSTAKTGFQQYCDSCSSKLSLNGRKLEQVWATTPDCLAKQYERRLSRQCPSNPLRLVSEARFRESFHEAWRGCRECFRMRTDRHSTETCISLGLLRIIVLGVFGMGKGIARDKSAGVEVVVRCVLRG